ncbi:MAG: ribonuclease HII [Desulfobacterales bacterium]|nr:ribonuclease HII [Desulfobacterales bacterium]
MWTYEKKAIEKGFLIIAGVDEAGRGPLAGPVVSASVILSTSFNSEGIKDSKQLSPKKREYFYNYIFDHAISIGVGIVGPEDIDRINILQAALLSMAIAVKKLSPAPEIILIDGQFPIPLSQQFHQQPIIKGDTKSVSIASASIIAKVTRDRIMNEYSNMYPQFGFSHNKGYPTKSHREAIQNFGCCPIHRKTFRGVKEYI